LSKMAQTGAFGGEANLMIDELYNTAILELAGGISHIGNLAAPQAVASKTAKLCGSKISVEISLNDNDIITEFAQSVKACAFGQAVAAILGKNIIGAKADEVIAAQENLWDMLRHKTPMPKGRFDELQKLAKIADLPQRHSSAALAFDAVKDAIEIARSKAR